jgi:hypothetical protein
MRFGLDDDTVAKNCWSTVFRFASRLPSPPHTNTSAHNPAGMPTIDGSPWVAGATSVGLGELWRGGVLRRGNFLRAPDPAATSLSALSLSHFTRTLSVASMLGAAAAAALVLSKAAGNLVVSESCFFCFLCGRSARGLQSLSLSLSPSLTHPRNNSHHSLQPGAAAPPPDAFGQDAPPQQAPPQPQGRRIERIGGEE